MKNEMTGLFAQISIHDYWFFGTYLFCVLALFGAFLAAVRVQELRREARNRRNERGGSTVPFEGAHPDLAHERA